jgi:hypothetical protein
VVSWVHVTELPCSKVKKSVLIATKRCRDSLFCCSTSEVEQRNKNIFRSQSWCSDMDVRLRIRARETGSHGKGSQAVDLPLVQYQSYQYGMWVLRSQLARHRWGYHKYVAPLHSTVTRLVHRDPLLMAQNGWIKPPRTNPS